MSNYFDAATYREAIGILETILDLHDAETTLWHYFPDANPAAVSLMSARTKLGAEAMMAAFEHESKHCHDCDCLLPEGIRFICSACIEDRRRLA